MGVKVLHVLDSLSMGGAETWVIELLRVWKKSKTVQVDILLTGGVKSVWDDVAASLGAKLIYCKYGKKNMLTFIREFRNLLRNEKYVAIHDHADYTSGIHFVLGLGLLPVVRVSHIHNPWFNITINYNTTLLRKITSKIGKILVKNLATHVCGTSRDVLEDYGFDLSETSTPIVKVLHCGIDIEKFSNADSESRLGFFSNNENIKIVLFVGRLDKALDFNHPQNHKNSWFALNIVKKAIEIDSRIRMLMVGAGEKEKNILENEINKWGLNSSIKLLGIRTDIEKLFHLSNLLLFPSRVEGLGMVAIEAQASNLPVLASANVPAACTIVPALFHRLSLDDSVDIWANKMIQIIDLKRPNRELSEKLVRESDFSIESSARKLEEIYLKSR